MNITRSQRIFLTALLAIAIGAGFTGGFLFFRHRNAQATDAIVRQVINKDSGQDPAIDFALFWQVWDKLQELYVDPGELDAQKLVYGAISGMVNAAGDPYTTFFEPITSRKFREEVSGEFSGVGMEVGMRNRAVTVIAPMKNSPALKAGVQASDVIVKIDGISTDEMSLDDAVNRIRGKKGTTVKLTIARTGEVSPLEFSIIRDVIRIPAVDWNILDGHIAYLQIYSFNANVDDEFARAAKEILDSDADRLIIDLRNNPGGLLDSAVNIGGWLLPPQTLIVQERFGNGITEQARANGNARLAEYPAVVILNNGSASASEILAGALHDIRDVPIVGEQSFGKGSVQTLESFYNGSSLKVTIAKWLTPNGVSISDTGIEPTVEVELDPKEITAGNVEYGIPDKDPQLKKALEIINNL